MRPDQHFGCTRVLIGDDIVQGYALILKRLNFYLPAVFFQFAPDVRSGLIRPRAFPEYAAQRTSAFARSRKLVCLQKLRLQCSQGKPLFGWQPKVEINRINRINRENNIFLSILLFIVFFQISGKVPQPTVGLRQEAFLFIFDKFFQWWDQAEVDFHGLEVERVGGGDIGAQSAQHGSGR